MKLSICMIVKDEEKNLKRCLDELKPVIQSGLAELIIVDTGSIDNTVKVAKTFTDKIYFHSWNKNFSDMRNKSISYAKGEWIFIIDADERLDDSEKLIALMKSVEINKFNTVILNIKNLYNPVDENSYNLIASPRIFKNDGKFKYEGAVHNQPIFKGPNLNVDINITHFGYISIDKELMDRKYKRTTELLKSELKKNPKNLYYMYQLGVSYDMHSDHKISLEEFRKAYKILKSKNLKEKRTYNYIYASYARIAYSNCEYKESIKIAKEGLTLKKDYIDLYYYIGLSEKMIGDKKSSYDYFKKYIELAEKYNQLDISKDLSIIMYTIDDNSKSNAYYEISHYYLNNRKYIDAYKVYNKIINTNQKIYLSVNILIKLMKYSELRQVYNNLKKQKERNDFLCTLEEKIKNLEEKNKIEVYKEFSLNEDSYGILNRIRLGNDVEDKFNLAKKLAEQLNFNEEPIFYSEIFIYMKKDLKLVINVFKNIEVYNLRNIVKQLIEVKGFSELFEDYILKYNINDLNLEELKVFISIATVIMLVYIKDNDKVNESYLNIFKIYVKAGVDFVSQLYQVNNANMIYKNINNIDDRFFIVMYIINKCIESNDKKSAVSYMIEAVNLNKPFSKYIDLYKNEIFNLKSTNARLKEKEQFENYKKKVKITIKALIQNNKLDDARKIIHEYEDIVKDDVEIVYLKSELSLKKLKNVDTNYKM